MRIVVTALDLVEAIKVIGSPLINAQVIEGVCMLWGTVGPATVAVELPVMTHPDTGGGGAFEPSKALIEQCQFLTKVVGKQAAIELWSEGKSLKTVFPEVSLPFSETTEELPMQSVSRVATFHLAGFQRSLKIVAAATAEREEERQARCVHLTADSTVIALTAGDGHCAAYSQPVLFEDRRPSKRLDVLLPPEFVKAALRIPTSQAELALCSGDGHLLLKCHPFYVLGTVGNGEDYPDHNEALWNNRRTSVSCDAHDLKVALREVVKQTGETRIKINSGLILETPTGNDITVASTDAVGTGQLLLDPAKLKALVEPWTKGTSLQIVIGAADEPLVLYAEHYEAGLLPLAEEED